MIKYQKMTKNDILTIFAQALVKDAIDVGFSIRIITLIKYLYLLDVYMAQTTGKKFTDFDWIFYKFGPFDSNAYQFIDTLIKNKLILIEEYESKYSKESDFIVLKPIENSPGRTEIWKLLKNNEVLTRIFKYDLPRFRDDTRSLLDYVYFETEPMHNVNMKERLNFDNLHPDLFLVKPFDEKGTISKTKINKIKELFLKKDFSKKVNTIKFPEYNDSLLEEFDKTFFSDNEIKNFSFEAELK